MILSGPAVFEHVAKAVVVGLLFWVGNAVMDGKVVAVETKGDIRTLSANVEGYQKTTEQAIRILSSRVDKIETRLDKIQEQTR